MRRSGRNEPGRPMKTQNNPYAGIKSDFEKLLTKFTETNSVRYEQFAEIWRELKMSLIFAGRQTDKECREFLEACCQVAISFLMPPYNFQVRVGALYILYGLYLKQPCRPMNKIRMTPEQWRELDQLMTEVREQQHLDTEYVYTTLEYHRAFTFVATPTAMYPMMKEMIDDDSRLLAKQDILTEQRSILSEILEPDNIDQLSAIHDQYHRTKCLLSGLGKTEPKTSLNVIKPSLVQYITKAVAAHEEKRKIIVGKKPRKRHDSRDSVQTTTSESELDSDVDSVTSKPKRQKKQASKGESTGSRRAEIKARAFTVVEKASKSRRHRQAVAESSQSQSEDFSPGSPGFSSPSPARNASSKIPKAGKKKRGPKPVKQEENPTTVDESDEFSPLGAQLKTALLSMPTLSEITSVEGMKTPETKKKGRSKKQKELKTGDGSAKRKKVSPKVKKDPLDASTPASVTATSPAGVHTEGETTPVMEPAQRTPTSMIAISPADAQTEGEMTPAVGSAKKRHKKAANTSESDISTPMSAKRKGPKKRRFDGEASATTPGSAKGRKRPKKGQQDEPSGEKTTHLKSPGMPKIVLSPKKDKAAKRKRKAVKSKDTVENIDKVDNTESLDSKTVTKIEKE